MNITRLQRNFGMRCLTHIVRSWPPRQGNFDKRRLEPYIPRMVHALPCGL